MPRTALLVLLSAPLVTACGAVHAELTDAERAAIRAEVEAAVNSYLEAWTAADFDRGIALFDDHPDFAFASNTVTWSSRDAADASFRPGFRNIARQDFEIEESRIAVLAHDVAHVTLRGGFTVTRTDGTVSTPHRLAFTGVWVKSGDAWRARFGHQSTAPVEGS